MFVSLVTAWLPSLDSGSTYRYRSHILVFEILLFTWSQSHLLCTFWMEKVCFSQFVFAWDQISLRVNKNHTLLQISITGREFEWKYEFVDSFSLVTLGILSLWLLAMILPTSDFETRERMLFQQQNCVNPFLGDQNWIFGRRMSCLLVPLRQTCDPPVLCVSLHETSITSEKGFSCHLWVSKCTFFPLDSHSLESRRRRRRRDVCLKICMHDLFFLFPPHVSVLPLHHSEPSLGTKRLWCRRWLLCLTADACVRLWCRRERISFAEIRDARLTDSWSWLFLSSYSKG